MSPIQPKEPRSVSWCTADNIPPCWEQACLSVIWCSAFSINKVMLKSKTKHTDIMPCAWLFLSHLIQTQPWSFSWLILKLIQSIRRHLIFYLYYTTFVFKSGKLTLIWSPFSALVTWCIQSHILCLCVSSRTYACVYRPREETWKLHFSQDHSGRGADT